MTDDQRKALQDFVLLEQGRRAIKNFIATESYVNEEWSSLVVLLTTQGTYALNTLVKKFQ